MFTPSRTQRGSTVIGFLVGLICGLGVAVAVAVFVTKAPIPFVNKANRPSNNSVEPKAGAAIPDPNKTLQSKAGKPAGPDPSAQQTADGKDKPEEEKKDSILGLLGTIGGAVSGAANTPSAPVTPAPAPSAPKTADQKPAPVVAAAPAKLPETKATADAKPADAKAADAKPGYALQVGSFVSVQDAENRKARLALAGFEAKIVQAEVDGKTVYRVRAGPYKDFDEMTKARGRITESGFDVSVARQ
jgi:cell division protein FtsN